MISLLLMMSSQLAILPLIEFYLLSISLTVQLAGWSPSTGSQQAVWLLI